MGRFRNPRYAPEFLEKKLSPVGISPALATAAFVLAPTKTNVSMIAAPPPEDGSFDNLPPYEPLPVTMGPAGPA